MYSWNNVAIELYLMVKALERIKLAMENLARTYQSVVNYMEDKDEYSGLSRTN